MFVPDLLFGSNVVAAVRTAGFSPLLVSDLKAVRAEVATAAALVVDLTADAVDRIRQLRAVLPADLRTLAFYSHVEADVRELASDAGFDLIVPRSRMAREGSALLQRLLADSR